jgi:DNA-binding MarR family transcriptional regulator
MSTMVDDRSAPREVRRRPLGPALRRAWVGYQQRLDEAMAAAGFDERGFPDGRVLRMCRDTDGITVSEIGRQLGISRQGASKVVSKLSDRGYILVSASPTSGREKVVRLTPRAEEYLAAQRTSTRAIDQRLRRELGAETVDHLYRALDALAPADEVRLRDYLRLRGVREI